MKNCRPLQNLKLPAQPSVIGRTWGNNSLGRPKDVGFGLRLMLIRSSGRDVIHVDIAFPLDGDASIDELQFLVESKRSF
jgi:hypothetical protein